MGPELYLTALRRLGHEVMFLTVETFSLHNGIAKDKSLISSSIKQNSALVTKVDRTDSITDENYTHLGVYTNEEIREATHEEVKLSIKESNRRHIEIRNDLKHKSGIRSKNHKDIEEWLASLVSSTDIKRLGDLRHKFAHSLDNLERIQNGTGFHDADHIEEILKLIDKILSSYKKRLNEILTITCSVYHEGIVSTYDSLSRLRFYHVNKESL